MRNSLLEFIYTLNVICVQAMITIVPVPCFIGIVYQETCNNQHENNNQNCPNNGSDATSSWLINVTAIRRHIYRKREKKLEVYNCVTYSTSKIKTKVNWRQLADD